MSSHHPPYHWLLPVLPSFPATRRRRQQQQQQQLQPRQWKQYQNRMLTFHQKRMICWNYHRMYWKQSIPTDLHQFPIGTILHIFDPMPKIRDPIHLHCIPCKKNRFNACIHIHQVAPEWHVSPLLQKVDEKGSFTPTLLRYKYWTGGPGDGFNLAKGSSRQNFGFMIGLLRIAAN